LAANRPSAKITVAAAAASTRRIASDLRNLRPIAICGGDDSPEKYRRVKALDAFAWRRVCMPVDRRTVRIKINGGQAGHFFIHKSRSAAPTGRDSKAQGNALGIP